MTGIIKNIVGDTIVEVLIAIVILSLILTGAYVSSNDSLLNIRDAQERVQALGVAQGQVETLRAQATTLFAAGANVAYLGNSGIAPTFCFNSTNTFQDYTSSPTSCEFSTIPYQVQIQGLGTTPGALTNTFKVTVTWSSVSPNVPKDELTIYYRVGI
jgi:Tfp pilus assembly protein PilV